MSDSTPVAQEVTPPSAETPQPAPAPTETVEELKERLAAAETEAKRWKNRVAEENPKKKKEAITSDDLDSLEWKLANKERINLVKDEYDKLLVDGYQGEKVSEKIALELAEKQARIDTAATKRDRQDDMTTPSVTNRIVNPQGYETEADRELGLTLEKKRKLEERHPHLKEV